MLKSDIIPESFNLQSFWQAFWIVTDILMVQLTAYYGNGV